MQGSIKNKHAYLFPEFCRLSLLVHGLLTLFVPGRRIKGFTPLPVCVCICLCVYVGGGGVFCHFVIILKRKEAMPYVKNASLTHLKIENKSANHDKTTTAESVQ